MEFKYLVENKYNSKRIVDILIAVFGISSLMQKKIRLYGNLWLNGIPARMIDLAEAGDLIVAHPSKDSTELKPAQIRHNPSIEILYEDDHVIVVNKPADLVVHPTMSHPDNTLLDLLSDQKLHSVTRIDRETSGALIIAKHGHAHYRIVQNPIKRLYWAFTHGNWQEHDGSIIQPIKRSSESFMIRIVHPEGKKAVTYYKVLQSFYDPSFDWIEFQLETGRTHQIRVHSLYQAHPLLGDGLYGLCDYGYFDTENEFNLTNQEILAERINPNQLSLFQKILQEKQFLLDRTIKRQALHSRLIGFTHPISNKYLEFEAPLPLDMKKVIL